MQVIVDSNIGADMKAKKASQKSQANDRARKAPKKSRQFYEILEQLSTLSSPSIMEVRVKSTKNNKIPNDKQGDYLSKQLLTAFERLPNPNETKKPNAKTKLNSAPGGEAKSQKPSHEDGKIPTSRDSDKAHSTLNKFSLSGVANPEILVSSPVKGDPSGLAREIAPDIHIKPSRGDFSRRSESDRKNVFIRRPDSDHKGDFSSRIVPDGRGDFSRRPESENQSATSASEAKLSSLDKPESPDPKHDNQNKPELDSLKGKYPKRKTDPHNQQGILEKPGAPNLEIINHPESNWEKATLSKPQLDSIVSNMIQQIKVAPSSLELSLKPEYLGKIQILLESNEGLISIKVIAQSGEAAHLLNSNLQNIKENLEQQGIKIQQMDVDLANQERSGNQKGGRDQTRQPSLAQYANIRPDYEALENREQIYLLPNKLNLWA